MRYLKKKKAKGKMLGSDKEKQSNLYAHRKYRSFREKRMKRQREQDIITEMQMFQKDQTIPIEDHLKFLKSSYPLCNHCKQLGKVKPGRVYDHIIPIEKGTDLFASENEMQWLCDDCHNKKRATTDKK